MAAVTTAVVGGVTAAASIGMGVANHMEAKSARKAAQRKGDQAVQAFYDFDIPTIESQLLELEELRSVGNLSPEQEEAILQQETELRQLLSAAVDPAKQAQMKALAELEEIADQGGLTAEDRARLDAIRSEVSRQEKGQREAILQNYAQRGLSGSGMELAAQLANQQGAAERASAEGFNTAARAEQRALEAILQSGKLAGDIRGQEASEQLAIDEAEREIQKMNTLQRADVQQRNVDRKNLAQQFNLEKDQELANQNVGMRNKEQQYNKELQQKKFANELDIARGVSGQLQQSASADLQAAQNQSAAAGNVASGLAKIGGTLTDYGVSKLDPEWAKNKKGT